LAVSVSHLSACLKIIRFITNLTQIHPPPFLTIFVPILEMVECSPPGDSEKDITSVGSTFRQTSLHPPQLTIPPPSHANHTISQPRTTNVSPPQLFTTARTHQHLYRKPSPPSNLPSHSQHDPTHRQHRHRIKLTTPHHTTH